MHAQFITFIAIFLFASAGLADSNRSLRSSQSLDAFEKRTHSELSGAVSQRSNASIWTVSGTFIVPPAFGSDHSGVGFWVGLDGSPGLPQCDIMFSAGVACEISQNNTTYTALARWSPQQERSFTDISVSAGDIVTVILGVTANATTGYATIIHTNSETKQRTTQTLEFLEPSLPLCQRSAEWYITKIGDATLADFRVVTFYGIEAFDQLYQKFTSAPSILYSIYENGQPATSVQVKRNGESLQIWYGANKGGV